MRSITSRNTPHVWEHGASFHPATLCLPMGVGPARCRAQRGLCCSPDPAVLPGGTWWSECGAMAVSVTSASRAGGTQERPLAQQLEGTGQGTLRGKTRESWGQSRTVLNTLLKNQDFPLHLPTASEGQGLGTEAPFSPDSLLQWNLSSTSNLNALFCKMGIIKRHTSSRGAVRKGGGDLPGPLSPWPHPAAVMVGCTQGRDR